MVTLQELRQEETRLTQEREKLNPELNRLRSRQQELERQALQAPASSQERKRLLDEASRLTSTIKGKRGGVGARINSIESRLRTIGETKRSLKDSADVASRVERMNEERQRQELTRLQEQLSASDTRLTPFEREAISEGRGVSQAITSASARATQGSSPRPSDNSIITNTGRTIPVSKGLLSRVKQIESKQGVGAFIPSGSGGFSQATIPSASSERVGAFTYVIDTEQVQSLRNKRLADKAMPTGLFDLRTESGKRIFEPSNRPRTFQTVNQLDISERTSRVGRVVFGGRGTSAPVNNQLFARLPARERTPITDTIRGSGTSSTRNFFAGVTGFVEERPNPILVQDLVSLRLGGSITKRGLVVASKVAPVSATKAFSFGTQATVSLLPTLSSGGAGVLVAEPEATGRAVVPTIAFVSGFRSASGSLVPRVTGVTRDSAVTTITSPSGTVSGSFTRGATNINFLDDSFSVPFTETTLTRSTPNRLSSLTRRVSSDPFFSQQQRTVLSRRSIGDIDVLSSGDAALLVRTSQTVNPEFGDSFSVVESASVSRRSPFGSFSNPQVTSEFSRVNPSGTTTTRSFLRQGENPSFDFGRFASEQDLFPSRPANRRGSLTIGRSTPSDDSLFGSRFLPDDIASPSSRITSPSRSLVPSVSFRSAFPRGSVRNNFFFGVPVNLGSRVDPVAQSFFNNNSLSPLRVGIGALPSTLIRSGASSSTDSPVDSGSIGGSLFDVGSLSASSSFSGTRGVPSSRVPSPFRPGTSRPPVRGLFPFVPPIIPFIPPVRGGFGDDSEGILFGKSRSKFVPSITAIAFNIRESSSKGTSGFTGFELRGLR